MCLTITRDQKQKVARRDIPIYKRLCVNLDGSGYYTPFRLMNVPKDGVMIPKDLQENIPVYHSDHAYVDHILGGAIHCYKKESDAMKIIDDFEEDIVIKGIIPKGTKYYEDMYKQAYAAQKVILTLPEN